MNAPYLFLSVTFINSSCNLFHFSDTEKTITLFCFGLFTRNYYDSFQAFIPVKEQMVPDPDFPTVRFPNPEEGRSALDLSFKTANENNCTVILANDPDADRLAVAEKQPR